MLCTYVYVCVCVYESGHFCIYVCMYETNFVRLEVVIQIQRILEGNYQLMIVIFTISATSLRCRNAKMHLTITNITIFYENGHFFT